MCWTELFHRTEKKIIVDYMKTLVVYKTYKWPTVRNHHRQSPIWGTDSRSAAQDIPCLLCSYLFYMASNWKTINWNEFVRNWPWPNGSTLQNFCLEGLRKTTKAFMIARIRTWHHEYVMAITISSNLPCPPFYGVTGFITMLSWVVWMQPAFSYPRYILIIFWLDSLPLEFSTKMYMHFSHLSDSTPPSLSFLIWSP
jgi:hypothetical protein